MRKTLATLLVSAAVAVPFAQAETKAISVDMTYDAALLQTEAGVERVLASLEQQATEACTYASPLIRTPKKDATCRDELIKKAVAEIRRVSLEDGTVTATAFANLETSFATPAQ